MQRRLLMELKGLGQLSVETTVVMRDRPISFLCTNTKNYFLFYEIYHERESTTWLMVPVKADVAKEILAGHLPVQESFRSRQYRSSERVFTVYKDTKSIKGKLREARDTDIGRLPSLNMFRTA